MPTRFPRPASVAQCDWRGGGQRPGQWTVGAWGLWPGARHGVDTCKHVEWLRNGSLAAAIALLSGVGCSAEKWELT